MPPAPPSILYTDRPSIGELLSIVGMINRLSDGGGRKLAITTATNAAPIQITTASPHLLATGDLVAISGVQGNVAANEGWSVTVIDSTNFTLDGSAGSGAGTGGTVYALPVTEAQYLTNCLSVGTARVNRYCQTNYDPVDLANSWSVWQWATICGAYWLCARRNNAVSASLQALYQEALDDMWAVKSGNLPIEDIGYRNTLSPVWSNVRLDGHYAVRQLRVERPLSERTPAQFPQNLDWLSEWLVEPPRL